MNKLPTKSHKQKQTKGNHKRCKTKDKSSNEQHRERKTRASIIMSKFWSLK